MEDPVRPKYVRGPLNVRHAYVSSPTWHPFSLTDLTVSATLDLVSTMHGLQEVQQHTQHRLPILADEHIHCCVLKVMYSIFYAQYNLPLFLARTPVVYRT